MPRERRGTLERAAGDGADDVGHDEAEGMPLGMLWPALLEEAHSRALKAEESAGLVEKQVVAPLAEAVRDLDIVRKALLAAGAREQKALQEMHTALRTAQSQYLRDKEVSDLSATKLARARSDPSQRRRRS